MTRIMIDAASPDGIAAYKGHYDLVAGYKTGTPGQNWAGHSADVWIDQHGFGEHNYAANVQDVEPQCWGVADVPEWVTQCTAERPTVYCDRSDYPLVRKLWHGDIWLAAPGGVNIANYPGVIAVQDVFAGEYDLTTVYDATWPKKALVTFPPPPPPVTNFHFSATEISRQFALQWDAVSEADHYVITHVTSGSNQIWRVGQPTSGQVILHAPLSVEAGALVVHAIVHSRPVLIVSEVI